MTLKASYRRHSLDSDHGSDMLLRAGTTQCLVSVRQFWGHGALKQTQIHTPYFEKHIVGPHLAPCFAALSVNFGLSERNGQKPNV